MDEYSNNKPKRSRKGVKKRRYSDLDRANALVALKANRGNVQLTARQTGIPPPTLSHWAKQERHPEATVLGEKQIEPLADKLENIARLLIDAMPDKIGSASLQQIATSAAIAIDKSRLLRGQATTIVQKGPPLDLSKLSDRELDDYERLVEKATDERQLQQGGSGQLPPSSPRGEGEGGRPDPLQAQPLQILPPHHPEEERPGAGPSPEVA